MKIYKIKICFPDGSDGYWLGERRLPVEFASKASARELLHGLSITDEDIEKNNIIFERGEREILMDSQRRRKYRVYRRIASDASGTISTTSWHFLGETFAVSEAQAVNNICYRNNLRANTVVDLGYDSSGWYEWRTETL